jgi:hypothetical protein
MHCAGPMRPNLLEAWLWLAVGVVAGIDLAVLWTLMQAALSRS